MGHVVEIVSPDPDRRLTVPLPTYPEIKLDFFSHNRIRHIYRALKPDYVHIATEGPLGWAARWVCLAEGKPFSTAFHTQFPEYVAKRFPPLLRQAMKSLTWAWARQFHAPSGAIMVPTPSIAKQLRRKKFHHIQLWSRGVDTNIFKPYGKNLSAYENFVRPISLYVGRVAVEKNLPDFLGLSIPGTKVVIGDGPDMAALREKFPQVHFLGKKTGEDLAHHYAAADLFVFPSHTDTFGLVILEALACGLPVAAYPAPGPKDIFIQRDAVSAFARVDEDLEKAALALLATPVDAEGPRAFAAHYSWEACTQQFFKHLQAETVFGKRRTRRFARALDIIQGIPRMVRRAIRRWELQRARQK